MTFFASLSLIDGKNDDSFQIHRSHMKNIKYIINNFE